jgi:HK97 family phage major capsid protein
MARQFLSLREVGPGSAYLMNQRTFGLMLTMSDAMGRPIMIASPVEPGQYLINGSPLRLVTQMPGATPVAFGNWNQAYTVVNRKAVTMLQDQYSPGFSVLFKFEARVGGGVICPNAARLLRIR